MLDEGPCWPACLGPNRGKYVGIKGLTVNVRCSNDGVHNPSDELDLSLNLSPSLIGVVVAVVLEVNRVEDLHDGGAAEVHAQAIAESAAE